MKSQSQERLSYVGESLPRLAFRRLLVLTLGDALKVGEMVPFHSSVDSWRSSPAATDSSSTK